MRKRAGTNTYSSANRSPSWKGGARGGWYPTEQTCQQTAIELKHLQCEKEKVYVLENAGLQIRRNEMTKVWTIPSQPPLFKGR